MRQVRDTSSPNFLQVSFYFSFCVHRDFRGCCRRRTRHFVLVCAGALSLKFQPRQEGAWQPGRTSIDYCVDFQQNETMSATATAASIPVPVEQSPATLDKIKGNIANEIARVPLLCKRGMRTQERLC